MRFEVLGRLVVLQDGHARPLGPHKQRLLLAVLLARAGSEVPTDELIDALWGTAPPASAVNNLYLYVNRLRRTLGDDRLPGRPRSGYLVDVRPNEFDVHHFTNLAKAGQEVLDAGLAARYLRKALGLWRGDPYEDLAGEPALHGEVTRLNELRLTVTEQRIEADLRLGRCDDLVGELVELVGRHPLRERFTAQLMRALYHAGRQDDALATYHAFLAPGPELRALAAAIRTGSVP
jgi:DNA-binding SARP family transcriptional activator